MAKIFYEGTSSKPRRHPAKSVFSWFAIAGAGVVMSISFKTMLSSSLFSQKMPPLEKMISFLTIAVNGLLAISIGLSIVVGLFTFVRFLWFGNPYNKGKPIIRLKQQLLARQIQKGMIDEGIFNPRKKSKGFEVSDVYPGLSGDRSFVRIEVVGNIANDLEHIERLINASLRKSFQNMIVDDYSQEKNGRWFVFSLRDSSISSRIIPTQIENLVPEQSHQLQLTTGVIWDISKSPHALIAGQTGSGKTYAVYGLLLQMLLGKAEVFIADPKKSALSQLQNLLPTGHVSSDKDEILEMLTNAVELMRSRQEQINNLSRDRGSFDDDFTAFPEMTPAYIIIDEVGALMASMADTKESKHFLSQLKQLVLKARSAGICIILLTQQPNANSIPTDIRDQLGLRILLGASSQQARQMVFGEGWEYTKTSFERGSGLFMLEGYSHSPTMIETIDLSQLGTDLYNAFYQATNR